MRLLFSTGKNNCTFCQEMKTGNKASLTNLTMASLGQLSSLLKRELNLFYYL